MAFGGLQFVFRGGRSVVCQHPTEGTDVLGRKYIRQTAALMFQDLKSYLVFGGQACTDDVIRLGHAFDHIWYFVNLAMIVGCGQTYPHRYTRGFHLL